MVQPNHTATTATLRCFFPAGRVLLVTARRLGDAAGTPIRSGYTPRMATGKLDDDAKRDVRSEFGEAVNMTANQLEKWLDTDESRSVGDTGGSGSESTGHEMGRHIVELRDKKAGDLDDPVTPRVPPSGPGIRRQWRQESSTTTTTRGCARSSATSTATWPSGRRATSPRRSGGTR